MEAALGRLKRVLLWGFLFLCAFTAVGVGYASGEDAGELAAIVDGIHDPAALASFSFPVNKTILRVAFPVIKECDSCLVTDGNESILIDCATKEQAGSVVSMLRGQGISRLDAVYITHPHPDHAGGLATILSEFEVGSVWTCFSDLANEISAALPGICEQFDVPLMRFAEGHTFNLGDASFKTYASDDRALSENDRSAAFRMQYGKAVMFFAADLEARGLRRIGNMLDPEELRMDIIKYPHHGKNGLVREFWRPAQLRFAVVTSDSTPREGKTDLIYKGWAHAFTADGEIVLLTDGDTWCICSSADAQVILMRSGYSQKQQKRTEQEEPKDAAEDVVQITIIKEGMDP